MSDPWPYNGPIARADGIKSFNHYLWPLEEDSFWPSHKPGLRVSSRFHFSVVGLSDGRWSVSGWIYDIEAGRGVFSTRKQALRTAVAKFIRLIRAARTWKNNDGGHHMDHLNDEQAQSLINYAYQALHRPPPTIKPIKKQKKITGLPLLDYGQPA